MMKSENQTLFNEDGIPLFLKQKGKTGVRPKDFHKGWVLIEEESCH